MKRLLCEGGGELNDALFRAGLVDEIHLTICPKIFGGRTAPTIADGLGCPRLSGAAAVQIDLVSEEKCRVIHRVFQTLIPDFSSKLTLAPACVDDKGIGHFTTIPKLGAIRRRCCKSAARNAVLWPLRSTRNEAMTPASASF